MAKTYDKSKTPIEWVVSCKDKEFYLTENQHYFLLSNQDKRFVELDDMVINPAFVSYMYQSDSPEEIRRKYPCKACGESGWKYSDKHEQMECEVCGGTGMQV